LAAREKSPPAGREITLRGLMLGALMTIVFTAANLFMGLKTGMTFSSSIPAAVISMAALRLLGGASTGENNMVQTQASAAGTLCNVILVLPALVMIGYWHRFPLWQTSGICLVGGLLGVLYSVPLRRTMVVESPLPFPEGVAAAEVLRAGASDGEGGRGGIRDLASGGLAGAAFNLCGAGFKLFGDGVSASVVAGRAVFHVGAGFSLALIGVGYLVGIAACLSLLLGFVLAWGVAVPVLTSLSSSHDAPARLAEALWGSHVRLIGAGIIAIGGIWTVLTLLAPIGRSIRHALASARSRRSDLPREEQDLPILAVGAGAALLSLPLGFLFASISWPLRGMLGMTGFTLFIVSGTFLAMLFGFLMAAACGYMAGLLGSSSSPISGIGVLGTLLASLLLSRFGGQGDMIRTLTAVALFVSALVVTVSSIANDNLQDLKTGHMVNATPWRQQVVLLVGVVVGAVVIAVVLQILLDAYGLPGTRPDAQLAAPQASLVTTIATGIFARTLPWGAIGIGGGLGAVLIAFDRWLNRRGMQLPVLTVGIGMYLPPTVVLTIALGGVIGWIADRAIRARTQRRGFGNGWLDDERERLRRRGVLLSSGFLVGESGIGMTLAALEVVRGQGGGIALVGAGFAPVATVLGGVVFVLALLLFFRAVSKGETEAPRFKTAEGAG